MVHKIVREETFLPPSIIGVQRRVKLRTSSFLCGGDPPTPPRAKQPAKLVAPFRNVQYSSFF